MRGEKVGLCIVIVWIFRCFLFALCQHDELKKYMTNNNKKAIHAVCIGKFLSNIHSTCISVHALGVWTGSFCDFCKIYQKPRCINFEYEKKRTDRPFLRVYLSDFENMSKKKMLISCQKQGKLWVSDFTSVMYTPVHALSVWTGHFSDFFAYSLI